jgi:5'-nucleotidase
MKILITNDDGIQSPVLPVLARWAQKLGEVTVVAPKVEQSAKSQAINIRDEVEVKRVDIGEGIVAYAMDSTPADCTRFGVLGLGVKYDLVISGINRGYNLGDDIVYSGTVGAIYEASRLGIRGLAISTDPDSLMIVPRHLDTMYEYITSRDLYAYNTLYNVNIPAEICGIRITRQGGMFFSDGFEHRGGDMYIQVGAPVMEHDGDLSVDISAVKSGYMSITPLAANRTDRDVFEKLKNL